MDHRAIEIEEMLGQAIDYGSVSATGTARGSMEENDFSRMTSRSPLQSSRLPLKSIGAGPSNDEPSSSPHLRLSRPGTDTIQHCLARINYGLNERRTRLRTRGGNPSCSIFRLPAALCGINRKAEEPEMVSVGPYHRGKAHLLEFEEHKWFFLKLFLARRGEYVHLKYYMEEMASLERRTRDCYSEPVPMSSGDFIVMMLLDGCFIVELLRHLGQKEDGPIDGNDPIYSQPWIIPVIIRDLLKLENQLPFFVLESLFMSSRTVHESKSNCLSILALEVFELAFPRTEKRARQFSSLMGNHLLQLFHLSLVPSNRATTHGCLEKNYRPSDQSIQFASQLRPSGIRFKSSKAESFLDIDFRNRVLEIPSITINDFTATLLINCLALEQCQESGTVPRYLTDYVSFMSCLINRPKDVSILCASGIITRFSQDDLCVANLFNKLGKNLAFNVDDCYLSEQFRDVESYYSSNWATMMRTYFASPWSFISVFSAFLVILLTATQTVIAVIGIK